MVDIMYTKFILSRSSGYVNKYTHAECYTNRKDLTQLWGFRDLRMEDQNRFMSEDQKRANFPVNGGEGECYMYDIIIYEHNFNKYTYYY